MCVNTCVMILEKQEGLQNWVAQLKMAELFEYAECFESCPLFSGEEF